MMQIVILCSQAQKEELMQSSIPSTADIIWAADLHQVFTYTFADAVLDLLFENDRERIKLLGEVESRLVIVNSVSDTLKEINTSFVRIVGWNTFLGGAVVEGCCLTDLNKVKAQQAMAQLGKKFQWLPDTPGFVTPRVVSMIINEAYLALEEGVSTPAEIDTAMKLGTAYPFGPIEWGSRIGLQNVVTLLNKLAHDQPRYKPAPLLVQETNKAI